MIKARHVAEAKIGFYVHLMAYISVNISLGFVWYFTGYSKGVMPWFIIVALLWGVGLGAHGIAVFANIGFLDRLTQQEYRKLKTKQGK